MERQRRSGPGEFVRSDDPGYCNAPAGDCAQEIGRDNWTEFFDDLSKQKEDAQVTVEVRGTESGGAHTLAAHVPFVGISVDRRQEDSPVEVILGGTADQGHITHVIQEPLRLWHQHDEQGHEMLQLIARDGSTTLVHFEQ